MMGSKNVRGELASEEKLANLVADSIRPRLIPDIEVVPWRNLNVLAVQIYGPGGSTVTLASVLGTNSSMRNAVARGMAARSCLGVLDGVSALHHRAPFPKAGFEDDRRDDARGGQQVGERCRHLGRARHWHSGTELR